MYKEYTKNSKQVYKSINEGNINTMSAQVKVEGKVIEILWGQHGGKLL